MIKFFRHIRQNLIMKNKTSTSSKASAKYGKYLKYAIGEIILVVIGILIALQVNNWNENRKTKTEINQTINSLEKDLIANFNLANQKLNFYKRTDSIIHLILNNKLTIEFYQNSSRLKYLVLNWDLYTPQIDNVDKFIKSEDLITEEFKPLISQVKLLKQQETWLNNSWDKFDKTIDDIYKFFSEQPWFGGQDALSKTQEINFMVNNTAYRQKVYLYWIVMQNYANNITRYRTENLATLAKIKQFKNSYNPQEMSAFLDNLGMTPFKAFDCDYSINDLDLDRKYRSHELLLNYTKNTVYLRVTHNRGSRQEKMLIKPFEFRYISGWPFGIEGDYNILVEELDNDGNCIKKFGALHNGYLLIE